MPSLSDDFQMPIMYQDLRNPNLGMLNMPPYFGCYTNYLGGIRMQPELQNDQVTFKNRAQKERNSLKIIGLILASVATLAILKSKGFFGWASKQCSGVKKWFSNLFKSKPTTPTPTPTPPPTPPPAP